MFGRVRVRPAEEALETETSVYIACNPGSELFV